MNFLRHDSFFAYVKKIAMDSGPNVAGPFRPHMGIESKIVKLMGKTMMTQLFVSKYHSVENQWLFL